MNELESWMIEISKRAAIFDTAAILESFALFSHEGL